MPTVIITTTSEIKRTAFETSKLAEYLRANHIDYGFMNVDDIARYAQPFTECGAMMAASQRIAAVRHVRYITDNSGAVFKYIDPETTSIDDDKVVYYDEAGNKMGTVSNKQQRIENNEGNTELIVIAIESYITGNCKDIVCVMINYYCNEYGNHYLVNFSPTDYFASFPDKYYHELMSMQLTDKGKFDVQPGFNVTVGELINRDDPTINAKDWHSHYNDFNRTTQIRETLDNAFTQFTSCFE